MEKEQQQDTRAVREKAKGQLSSVGGLGVVSKTLAQQLQLPNLRYFGTERDDDKELRNEWLEEKDYALSRKEMKDKLNVFIELLESSDVTASAKIKKQSIQQLKDENIAEVLDKSRKLEKAWRELDIFYTNAAERELRALTILNVNTEKSDETLLVNTVSSMLEEVNKSAIDQSKSYSFLVAPGFLKESLIEKFSSVAYKNKILFITDFPHEKKQLKSGKEIGEFDSVDAVVEKANVPGRPKLGGLSKDWSRTVVFTNYVLLRDKYKQEQEMLFGSPAAAVAGKLYSIDNIAQPVAGAQFGALKGLKGIRFRVSQDQANTLDRENLNPLTEAFGALMPFNCVTMFKGENVELRQYNVVRTLDYVDKLLKHFLNQYVFTSMLDENIRLHVHRTIFNMLQRLKELKILKEGEIDYFEVNDNHPNRFDIKLKLTPMFVTTAFDYTLSIEKGKKRVTESDKNA